MGVNDKELIKKVCDNIKKVSKEDLDKALKKADKVYQYELFLIAQDLWGSEPIIKNTKVNGIYDVSTSRHGGYLVNTNLHPDLKKYGSKTYKPNICAFEEDLETLKVLWLYPELINNKENVDKWLNHKMIMDTYKGAEFLKEFPERKLN